MSKNLLAEIFSLSAKLVEISRSSGITLATAESCTGGLIGAAITATPGSSAVFQGGIIAYDNNVKINQLSVNEDSIKTHGSVSQKVAEEMAFGCREALSVNLAISVTGIAGPSGGTDEKPVGTVWIGLATKDGVTSALHNFPDKSRNKVRDYTCLAAIETLIDAIAR